jgi:hypothetical protein
LDPKDAAYHGVIGAGEPWMGDLHSGDVLRIVDVNGRQTADTLFYNAQDVSERYSAQDTIRTQGNVYPRAGTRLMSNANHALVTILSDTCGRHDTLGGACGAESNMVRFSLDKGHMHACRNNFLRAMIERGQEMTKRDLTGSISFFRNIAVTAEGRLSLADSPLKPGRYVELRAEMDVLVLISNCPQLNMPWNEHHPASLELLIWHGKDE